MARKGRLIKQQELSEKHAQSSEHSPYWEYVKRFGGRQKEGTIIENKFANPDTLSDDPANLIWGTSTKPELAELIIERFSDNKGQFPILSKMENKVLSCYLRLGKIGEVCTTLKISRSSCTTYMARISKKFKRLLPILNY